MKSRWFAVGIVATVAFLWLAQAKPNEPNKAPAPGADPMRGQAPGEVRDDNGLKLKLVWCPPGIVTMEQIEGITEPAHEQGDEKNDDEVEPKDDENDDEKEDDEVEPKDEPAPQAAMTKTDTPVKVLLTQGYWLGKYEVTQSEWKAVMKTEPWKGQRFKKEGAEYPATFISWEDAVDFCHKLTEQERQAGRLSNTWEYALPTEAQWERACRARTRTKFHFGDDESELGDYAWFGHNAGTAGEEYAHRVGQKKANAWGLYDMHGNVGEWCRDRYTDRLPGGLDPEVKPDEKTGGRQRVNRGGGWRGNAADCRSAARSSASELFCQSSSMGFRLALNLVR